MLNLHLGPGVIQAWMDPRDCFVHTRPRYVRKIPCVNMELLKKSVKMYISKDVCPFRVGTGVGGGGGGGGGL